MQEDQLVFSRAPHQVDIALIVCIHPTPFEGLLQRPAWIRECRARFSCGGSQHCPQIIQE